MKKTQTMTRGGKSPCAGSALLLTLLVVSLLMVVALSFVAFIRLEVRGLQNHQDRMTARANARLALGIAIGQLQQHAGPDARVTARADLAVVPGAPEGTENWVGVFRSSFSESGRELTENPDNGAFLGWLVSGAGDLPHRDFTGAQLSAFPDVLEIVPALAAGGLSRAAVRVPLAGVGPGPDVGAYGFWVSDENQKLHLNTLDRTDGVRHNAASYPERRFNHNTMGENYSDTDFQHDSNSGFVPGNGFRERERLRQLAQQTPFTGLLLNRVVPGADPALLVPNTEKGPFMNLNDLLLDTPNFGELVVHDATSASMSVLTNVPEGRLRYDLSDVPAMHSQLNFERIFGPDAVRDDDFLRGASVFGLMSSRHQTDKPVRHRYNNNRSWLGLTDSDVHAAVAEQTPVVSEFGARFMLYIGDLYGNPVGAVVDPGLDYYVCVGVELEWELWNPYRWVIPLGEHSRLGATGWPRFDLSVSDGTVQEPHIQLDHLLFHSLQNPYAANRPSLDTTSSNPQDYTDSRYKFFTGGDASQPLMNPGEVLVMGTPGHVYRAPAGLHMWQKQVGADHYPANPMNPQETGNNGHFIRLTPNSTANMMVFVLDDNVVSFNSPDPGAITVTLNSFHNPSRIDGDFGAGYRGTATGDFEEDLFTLHLTSRGNRRDFSNNYHLVMHPPGRFTGSTETYPAGDNSHTRWGFGWALRDEPGFFLRDYDPRRTPWHEPEDPDNDFRTPLNDGFDSRAWKSDLGGNAGNRIPTHPETAQFLSTTGHDPGTGLALYDLPRQEPLTLSVFKPLAHAGTISGEEGRPFYFGHPWGGDNNRPWDSAFFSTLPRGIGEFQPALEDIRMGNLPNTLMVPAFDTETLPPPDIGFAGRRTNDGNHINWGTVTGMMRYDISSLYLMQAAGFNINSTSVPAWEGLLAGGQFRVEPDGEDRRWRIHGDGGSNVASEELRNVHFTMPQSADYLAEYFNEADIEAMSRPASEESSATLNFEREVVFRQGVRSLTDSQVTEIAEKLVEKIKAHVRSDRGGRPFTSVREFVNAGLLDEVLDPERGELSDHPNRAFYTSPDDNYRYTPAYLSQADILGNVSHFLTPRGDTFLIRVYGDARNAAGDVVSRAHAEALVQRVPDPVSPLIPAPATDAELHERANKLAATQHPFGRRFRLLSLKWLNPETL